MAKSRSKGPGTSAHGGAGKGDGNPFFAFRVDAKLMRGFRAAARQAKLSPTDLARQLMANVAVW